MADVNVALLVSQTVTETQSQSRIKMGRNYASFYEAWAVLRQRIEETKRDAKALEKRPSRAWRRRPSGPWRNRRKQEKPSPGRGWAMASADIGIAALAG